MTVMISTKQKAKVNKVVSTDLILIENNLISIPNGNSKPSKEVVATIFANLAYYGYVLSKDAYEALNSLNRKSIESWWATVEPVLKEITGESKKMTDYVVYKNFPQEVLDMSQTQYWFSQILMYIGFPNEMFTEDEAQRKPLKDKLKLKVLQLSNDNSTKSILGNLLGSPARWTNDQFNYVCHFIINEKLDFDVTKIPFKENMVNIVSKVIDDGIEIKIKSATDVLRLAIGLSDGDVTMRTNTKFKSFSRKRRKFLLNLLNNFTNLQEDMARDTNKWKKFVYSLHPGDYGNKFKNVVKAYNLLYNDKIKTFNSKLEVSLSSLNGNEFFSLIKQRPGDFVRRLNASINAFGDSSAKEFVKVVDKLTVSQLLKLKKYLETCNERIFRTIAPKGNWTKMQILPNTVKINDKTRLFLINVIEKTIAAKVKSRLPKPLVFLGENIDLVKLQTSDSDLTPYGRGTAFPIPDNINFIRTASYWSTPDGAFNTWFDNGWNFFNKNWEVLGTCCWNSNRTLNDGSIFSGDPTNSKTKDGRACQMIDLYLDKLEAEGVRYAVWNILAYSNIKFNQATDVFAALQWGEKAQMGKLFEPSRCQLAFQLKGDNLTKYIAYIDIKERKLVYMDANLYGNVQSAATNGQKLQTVMPAFVEYLETIPSVKDLFTGLESRLKTATKVVYNDDNVLLKDGEQAYVFKPINEANSFTQLDLTELLK